MLVALNDLETTAAIVDRHHDELAGVIVEPFQRVLAPRPGFLAGLRELTARYGIPLIFDEVVTSFRFAFGGAQEFYGITPDLCALGKAVGGGFPLTAVAGRDELMAHFDQSRGPEQFILSRHAERQPDRHRGRARHVRILKRPGTYERMHALGRQLKRRSSGLRRGRRAARSWARGALRDLLHHARHRLPLDAQGGPAQLTRFVRFCASAALPRASKFYLSIATTSGREGDDPGVRVGDRGAGD